MRIAGKVELFDDATAGTAAITLIEIASTLARRMVRFSRFVIVVPVKPSPLLVVNESLRESEANRWIR